MEKSNEKKEVIDEVKEELNNNSNSTKKNKSNKKTIIKRIFIIIGIIIISLPVLFIGLLIFQSALRPIEKPIIYLYPEEEINVSVKLGNPEKITCSYPEYKDGWKVIAEPDGTLTDVKTQRELYALYWEGKDAPAPEMTEGFIVKGEDTIEFLEEKLEILGLDEREAEEFIIYWLPKMQNNEYNYIRFATMEEINEYMPLEFSVQPDTVIRVLMQFKGLDKYIEIEEQELETPKREGFVVVEWGGTEIK